MNNRAAPQIQPDEKPRYISPQITSYSMEMLQKQLGSAQAITMRNPDADVFGDLYD